MSRPLTQTRLRELLNYDTETGLFSWRRTMNCIATKGSAAGSIRPDGYISISIDKTHHYAHRLAWLYVFGQSPRNQIDHVDHSRTNNRINNLREVTASENHRNVRLPANNASGAVGVSFCKDRKKWVAYITHIKPMNLGRFNCITAAVIARKSAEVKFGYHPNHGSAT